MNNVQLMYVVNTRDYLLEKLTSLFFLKPSVCYYVIEQLSPTGILHDQIKLLRGFNDLIKLNDVRMSD